MTLGLIALVYVALGLLFALLAWRRKEPALDVLFVLLAWPIYASMLAPKQAPEDVADMVVFLSSNRAAHVTGQTINVDGGFVMHW